MVLSGVKKLKEELKEEKNLARKGEFVYKTEFFKLLTLCNTIVCE